MLVVRSVTVPLCLCGYLGFCLYVTLHVCLLLPASACVCACASTSAAFHACPVALQTPHMAMDVNCNAYNHQKSCTCFFNLTGGLKCDHFGVYSCQVSASGVAASSTSLSVPQKFKFYNSKTLASRWLIYSSFEPPGHTLSIGRWMSLCRASCFEIEI